MESYSKLEWLANADRKCDILEEQISDPSLQTVYPALKSLSPKVVHSRNNRKFCFVRNDQGYPVTSKREEKEVFRKEFSLNESHFSKFSPAAHLDTW